MAKLSRAIGTPRVKESEIQRQIEDALRIAGFTVLHTSAFRQKGPSGVSPGVPDLLVTHDCIKPNWLGLEVKTTQGRLSPAQRRLSEDGLIRVVRSSIEALQESHSWLCDWTGDDARNAREKAFAVLASFRRLT